MMLATMHTKMLKENYERFSHSYLEKNGKLKYYDIIVTSNLATKHPFFEYARSFDFIIVSDIGLVNVDVKSWGEKTFYHFDVPDEHDTEMSNSNIEKVVGHYISQQYHDQFNHQESLSILLQKQFNQIVLFMILLLSVSISSK